MQRKSNYNLFYRISSCALIILHLVTFGPIRDALAFSTQSASYKLDAATMNEGGASCTADTVNLGIGSIGEPCAGRVQSASYILDSGIIPVMEASSAPPELTRDIPYQFWSINTSRDNAFDLDDYFASTDGYVLAYTVMGNSNINVTIDPETHVVSLSQDADWYGVEKVYFKAADTQNSVVQSNEVSLQVGNSAGRPNKPVIVAAELTPSPVKEGDLVILTVKAYDLDGNDLTFSYSDFFTETRHWKEGGFWYSEATWQTEAGATGHYNVKVTVTDSTKLTDTKSVLVNIGNLNHPPILNPISDITKVEGQQVLIEPSATDIDGDPITFSFSSPVDVQGSWFTGYDDAGTYNIQVTASDGIDTVSQNAKVIINNTNRAPEATLTLSKYTVKPNEEFNILLLAVDLDGNTMTFSLKKDGTEIASGDIISIYNKIASFSDIGDHTITAVVTDSAGLSTSESKGVDVAERRDSISPAMGDFNGDALTDLGLYDSDSGKWEVCISKGGVFENAVDWLVDFGDSRDWWPIGGDFNGDGKTDVGIYNYSNGELKIALSTGSSFSTPEAPWLNFSEASYSWQPFTGNFNADKYTDFGLYNKDTGEVKVALGTGSGFREFATWIDGFGNDYIVLGGDFNGDGLTDLCLFKKSSGEFKVAFSNSKAFVDGSSWPPAFAANKDVLISDFNNDGLADVGYWDRDAGKWYHATSKGDSFVDKGIWLDGFAGPENESVSTGDFNGDGLTDAACFDRDRLGIRRWLVKISQIKPADLLTEIDNGIGGKTKITYTYAAKEDNEGLPFPVYVASGISLANTLPVERAAIYTQDFNFSGGYYDITEREFRGFARVKVTDPLTKNYTETYFFQGRNDGANEQEKDGALKGRIKKIIAYDGNLNYYGIGRKISETVNEYNVIKGGPEGRFLGFPALIEQETTVWEENGTSLATRDRFTYDTFGNVKEQVNEGDISKSGDEKTGLTSYAGPYEKGFNRPLETVLKDKDANIISKKTFEYADNRGNLTRETAWFSAQEQGPYTQYAYDPYGNVVSTTNALGHTVTTEYETDFYTYPQKVTNSLTHSIRYVYDPKFGVVKSVTDANDATSTTTYDSLARPLQVKNAYNQIVTVYSYSDDFRTKTTTNAADLFKTEYIDGLGRKYKTVSNGEDGTSQKNISTEVFYNARGLVDRESLPHYENEGGNNISYVRYRYDLRGRIRETISDFVTPMTSTGEIGDYSQIINKDAVSKISYINPLYTETTDPLGHRKGILKDVFGNIVEVTEFTSNGVFKTKYEYDIKNNLTKTTDNQGNVTQVFYDTLGRKTKMIDPDMGEWSYEYDLIGNLIRQADAKGQVLEFKYDALNRLEKKFTQGQDLTIYHYDETAYYDAVTKQEKRKPNCIGRLSRAVDRSDSTEFFYDKQGREVMSVKTIDGVSYAVSRAYDILDRLTKLKYPDGETVSYSYDENSGLLEKVEGTRLYVKDIAYNAQGQIKAIQYGNKANTIYAYGQDLRLSRIYTQRDAPLQDLNYAFDKNGNLTTLTDKIRNNTRTYAYDDLGRLTEAHNLPGEHTEFHYRYDSIGNMIDKSDIGHMAYGQNAGPHALTSAGGYSYQYDANGNMIVGKNNKTFGYDVENRLLEVNESGIITAFAYDGDGGLVKVTSLRGAAGSEAISTFYVGSLYEKESDSSFKKHIYAGSNKVATVESTGSINYFHSDHLGSSSVITDASGKQVSHYEYTPYGTLAQTEGADTTRYKFTGKQLFDSIGLYHYGARFYDPEIGRFITADTIVQAPYDPQSLNRYSYCRNNPINYVDPTGHSWFSKFFKKVGEFFENLVKNPAVLIAGIVGGALFGWAGYSFVHSFMLPSMSIGGISVMEGAIMTGVEFGIGGFGSGLASGFAGGMSAGDAFKNAGFGFASGFMIGGIAGATHAAGWQNVVHGVESEKINNLYSQAEGALKSGNLQAYAEAAAQLQALGATPPQLTKSILGIYRDPATPLGNFADNPAIYSKTKMDYVNFGISGFKKNYGIAGTFLTKEGFEGSTRIFVYGLKETMQPTSWLVQIIKKSGNIASTRWSQYDWMSVTEDVARRLDITKEATDFFSK